MIRWPFGEAGPELDPCPMIPDEPSAVSSLLRQATRQGLRLRRPTRVSMNRDRTLFAAPRAGVSNHGLL